MTLTLSNNGWGGIRTHERLSPLPVFKTGAFNRSATHPEPDGGFEDEPGRSATRANFDAFPAVRLPDEEKPAPEAVLRLVKRLASLPPQVRAVLGGLFGPLTSSKAAQPPTPTQ